MPNVAGRKAQVLFGGYDVSGYLSSAELSVDVDTAETTTFSQTSNAKTHMPTLYGATLSTSGRWDPAWETAIAAVIGTDLSVVTYCPGGASSVGDRARIMAVTSTAYGSSDEVDGVVAFSWDLMAETPVSFGWLLHPLAEDTNTTTGSSRDDAGATSTGWTASLHVTAVDGGSWVVTIEDSANASAWSTVTGGTFTAATGVTAQRLVSADGATLRRYVRYTATRTGGTGGDGVTFALAYSRSTS